MHRAGGVVRVVLAVGAVVLATGGVVTVFAPQPGATVVAGSATSGVVAWVLLGATAALVAAGAVAWVSRPGSTLALIALWTAAAWTAPELVGSAAVPDLVRALARLVAPLLVALVIHLSLRTLRADRGRARWVAGAFSVAVAVVGVAHAVTWDAFLAIDCSPFCHHDNPLALVPDLSWSVALRAAWGLFAVSGGLALATWSVVRARAGVDRAERDVIAASAGAGLALAFAGWAVAETPDPLASSPTLSLATVVLGVALVGLGVAVAWSRLRSAGRAARLRRLVDLVEVSDGEVPLQATLARLLGDPGVRIAYPVDRGWIDDQGLDVMAPVPGPGRARLTIEREGEVVAVVDHAADLDPELLAGQVGTAARLAVDNERLAASLRARVRELSASRSRIVAAGDVARRRLERDLHDGAQQGLLAVSYELRLAAAAAGAGAGAGDERRADLAAAVTEVDRTLAELRELAHGIWPAVLAEAGLEAALQSLADDAPIPVTLDGLTDERLAPASEAAAYLAATEALQRAVAAGAPTIALSAARAGDTLRLTAHIPAHAIPGPWVRVDDRVGAAGGRSEVTADRATGTLLTVELPCA